MGFFKKSQQEKNISLEETKIKECVVNILKKENTVVSMAPLSQKYFVINKDIHLSILIDGGAESVKTSNHAFKYGWKFRGDFIDSLIKIVIDWIEEDRMKIQQEIFINEINLLNDINNLIEGLPNIELVSETPDSFNYKSVTDGATVIG